jgi:hypothetical protein
VKGKYKLKLWYFPLLLGRGINDLKITEMAIE